MTRLSLQLAEARVRLSRAQAWLKELLRCQRESPDATLSGPDAAVLCHIAGEKEKLSGVTRCKRCDRILELDVRFGWPQDARISETPAGAQGDGGFGTQARNLPLCAAAHSAAGYER